MVGGHICMCMNQVKESASETVISDRKPDRQTEGNGCTQVSFDMKKKTTTSYYVIQILVDNCLEKLPAVGNSKIVVLLVDEGAPMDGLSLSRIVVNQWVSSAGSGGGGGRGGDRNLN